MQELIVPYGSTLAAFVCLGGLFLVQALVSDVAAIRAGHVPGMPVASGHDHFLFRATRAQANTNENLGVFLLLCLSALLLGASPWWTNLLAWTFVLSRLAHMLAYYGDQRMLRSAMFSVSLGSLIGLFVVAIATLGS